MIDSSSESWQQLFHAANAPPASVSVRFHLLRRRGEPLLLIPAKFRLVRESLSLYPAQTWRARLFRIVAGIAVRLHLPGLTEPFSLALDPQAAFVRFAASESELSRFAMLFGNPKAVGRRLVLLVFDCLGRPTKVIKVGLGDAAVELIRREFDFFTSAGGKLEGIPKLLGNFAAANVSAVALEYVPGATPTTNDSRAVAKVLGAWLDRERLIGVADLPAWQRLRQVAAAELIFRDVETALSTAWLRPAVFHGDFAPWNIRVKPLTGEWIVLDWERGEIAGPPAWDWFHFVMQPMLLVAKLPPPQIADVLERFLNSSEFLAYAVAAQIKTITRPLFLAYLLYCRDVLKPVEGRETTRALLELLRQRWRPI